MVNNSTNINKTNNHLSPSLNEHKRKDHDIWRRKSSPGLGQAKKCGRAKPVDGIPVLTAW
jgi:hypothetical protein